MDALASNHPPLSEHLSLTHEGLKAEIVKSLADLGEIAIASDADIVAAREKIKPLKALQTKVEATRKEEKQPFLDGGDDVDAFFKAIRVELDKVVSNITTKANTYQIEKREAAKRLEAAKARIAAAMQEAPPAPVAAAATVRVTTATGAVAASGSVKWEHVVEDASQLPRDLLMPNEAAIKARRDGLKAQGIKIEDARIPGVRIFEKVGTSWR